MIAAAKAFFTEDMNIPESTFKKMKIVKVFKPANADETDKLYVEFENESSVNILNRYRRNLAAGLRIFPWFPPALYPRFKALDDESYQIRKVRQPFHQTDIRYDVNDIALYKRLNKSYRWEKVEVLGLPDIVLDPALLIRPSASPPRGRNRISSKRKRSSSRSPAHDQHVSKTPRLPAHKETEKIDETEAGKIDESEAEKIDGTEATDDNLDTEVPAKSHLNDAGQFTEHHSYSPARPAPSKHSMITTTPGVLSKLKQPKLNYKPVQQSVKSKMDFQ
jgi:hypothetical protein